MNIPEYLPRRLTISLWDFSWYTMTQPGEPYSDLAARFKELVERGYNTIRICAMPLFLFDEHGQQRPGTLRFGSLGEIGRRTRWYNCQGGAVLDGHAHLLELFRQAKAHGCYVILSSWEYQQSATFLETSELARQLQQIKPQNRFMALAKAMSRLIDFLKENGYREQIAYAELHNEVEFGALAQVGVEQGILSDDGPALIASMRPYVEEGIEYLRNAHRDILITACYTLASNYSKDDVAPNVQVAHFHLYLNGVLQELMDATGIRSEGGTFPNAAASALLRDDAPDFADYCLPEGEEWRLQGNPVGLRLFYLHDWSDPDKWDLFLYDRYHAHKVAMLEKTDQRYEEIGSWAERKDIPVVIGEGYVGYTPLYTNFEEGPVGKFIAEYAIRKALQLGFWGMVLCSNCAPHHPFWQDAQWQKRMNELILNGEPT
ncbi:cellulase-like family protein [Paenibacillus fonticola]|uniref:cellulase-like family protein n=1 Tax=Paenibacillus fonticola TaxID=379896 RepID=UPI0003685119|nr:cellulase-like family protein [Paenibacillus fonticola]